MTNKILNYVVFLTSRNSLILRILCIRLGSEQESRQNCDPIIRLK